MIFSCILTLAIISIKVSGLEKMSAFHAKRRALQ